MFQGKSKTKQKNETNFSLHEESTSSSTTNNRVKTTNWNSACSLIQSYYQTGQNINGFFSSFLLSSRTKKKMKKKRWKFLLFKTSRAFLSFTLSALIASKEFPFKVRNHKLMLKRPKANSIEITKFTRMSKKEKMLLFCCFFFLKVLFRVLLYKSYAFYVYWMEFSIWIQSERDFRFFPKNANRASIDWH